MDNIQDSKPFTCPFCQRLWDILHEPFCFCGAKIDFGEKEIAGPWRSEPTGEPGESQFVRDIKPLAPTQNPHTEEGEKKKVVIMGDGITGLGRALAKAMAERKHPAAADEHLHVQLPNGPIVCVSHDASPELLGALDKMVELAKEMPEDNIPVAIPEEIREWVDANEEKDMRGDSLLPEHWGWRRGAIEMWRYLNAPEQWKEIIGFENQYLISTYGRVESIRSGKILIPLRHPQGYRMIGLYEGGEGYRQFIHILVAQHFIPNPENKRQVNHLNGIKDDNRIINLEWATFIENREHAIVNDIAGPSAPKKVIDNDTGIVYPSIKDASIALGIGWHSLSKMLRGVYKNKTNAQFLK